MTLDSPLHLIEALRQGRPVILVDGEEEGGDGMLVQAAEFIDDAALNFFAVEARGLVCLALTDERCAVLGLRPMTDSPRRDSLGFMVSIEAAQGISTGISAADRARTVQVAVDPASTAADLVSPGHIFPLRALPGGVMSRAGHAEAACDLARLAGLQPAALLAGILDEAGENARGEVLRAFAQRHGLPIGGIAELKWVAEHAYMHSIMMAPHGTANGLLGLGALINVCATLPANYIAFEYPSASDPLWNDIVTGLPRPLVKDGFITVPDKPGLGIDDVVDEVISQHLQPGVSGIWQPTARWDDEYSWDRTWS